MLKVARGGGGFVGGGFGECTDLPAGIVLLVAVVTALPVHVGAGAGGGVGGGAAAGAGAHVPAVVATVRVRAHRGGKQPCSRCICRRRRL